MKKTLDVMLGVGFILAFAVLVACAPVKNNISNQYKLESFGTVLAAKHLHMQSKHASIIVTRPEAAAGYQSNQMLYMNKPHELTAFINNAWVDPPADMLLPLIVRSLQTSGYFYAVASSPMSGNADYYLDVQLIELQQNFIKRPSYIDLIVKVVLTRTVDDKVIASRIIHKSVRCPYDTPYGGVIAANQATKNFTMDLMKFIVHYI